MPLPFKFDFRKPDYTEVFAWRAERLERLRKEPENFSKLKKFYRDNPAQFITDWGMTFDPRNPQKGLLSVIPFVLFPAQEDWVNWLIERYKSEESGVSDKSRDMGLSWLTTSVAASICLHASDPIDIGFLSRKEEYVDSRGDIKSLIEKVRSFLRLLPVEFRGGWTEKNSVFKRVHIPETGCNIRGEAGDGAYRGDRLAITFVDEAAHIPRAHLLDDSLSAVSECRIDISTPKGMVNRFAEKRWSGTTSVFSLHWKLDPRKDDAWYEKKCRQINNEVVIAQEIDLDYNASQTGIVIPNKWVIASIDAHEKLGIDVKGKRLLGFDVADEGDDDLSTISTYGILVESGESWSGKGSDIFKSVEKVFMTADEGSYEEVVFDSDGVGAGVRGDAEKINSGRSSRIVFTPFHGSGKIDNETGDPFDPLNLNTRLKRENQKTNADFFVNAKSQAWWQLRIRFRNTYRAIKAIKEGLPFDKDQLISISSKWSGYMKLVGELSQPTYSFNSAGKVLINKKPDGTKSPNLADACMMAFYTTRKRKGFFSA